jgi:hypothetical protein
MRIFILVALAAILIVGFLVIGPEENSSVAAVYVVPSVTPYELKPGKQAVKACDEITRSYTVYEAGDKHEINAYCLELLNKEIQKYGWPGEKMTSQGLAQISYAQIFANSLYHALVEQGLSKNLAGYKAGQIVTLSTNTLLANEP